MPQKACSEKKRVDNVYHFNVNFLNTFFLYNRIDNLFSFLKIYNYVVKKINIKGDIVTILSMCHEGLPYQ